MVYKGHISGHKNSLPVWKCHFQFLENQFRCLLSYHGATRVSEAAPGRRSARALSGAERQYSARAMGARRNFSRGGQNHQHIKKLTRFFGAPYQESTIFRRAKGANKKFCVFRGFLDWNIWYLWRAPGASENFGVFCRTAAYDVTFSNSRGGGASAPPASAHGQSCTAPHTLTHTRTHTHTHTHTHRTTKWKTPTLVYDSLIIHTIWRPNVMIDFTLFGNKIRPTFHDN